jgi:hypothetical protein
LKAAREADVDTQHIVRALKLAGRIREVTTSKIDDLIEDLQKESEKQ